jgi:hypothetical protein
MYMWYISIYIHVYNFCVSQVGKALRSWCRLLSHSGVQFLEVLESLLWIRSEVYLSIHCITVEGLKFNARVVCAGGERVTLCRCQDKTATRVGVACGGVIY